MIKKSENLRELAWLTVPWIIGLAVGVAVIFLIPMRTNSLAAYASLVIPPFVGSILIWVPPFRATQIRRLKRKYPKSFQNLR